MKSKEDCRECRHFQVVSVGAKSLTYRCSAKTFGCLATLQLKGKSYGQYIGCDRFEPLDSIAVAAVTPAGKPQQLSLFDLDAIEKPPDPEPPQDKGFKSEQGRSPLDPPQQLHNRKLGERFEVFGPDGDRLSLVCIDFGPTWVIGMDRRSQQWICDCKTGEVVEHEWRSYEH